MKRSLTKLQFCLLALISMVSTNVLQAQLRSVIPSITDRSQVKEMKEKSRQTHMSVDMLMLMDYMDRIQADELDQLMPELRNVLVIEEDMIALEVISTEPQACMQQLKSKGAKHVKSFRHMINCMVPMDRLHDLEGLAEAQSMRLVYQPIKQIGATTSQGDIAQLSQNTRSFYGVDGTGNKIGVISDTYDDLGGAAMDIATGDLPGPGNPNGFTTPVDVLLDATGGIDEGRAMAQLVHDVAPGAELAFHTALGGQATFANGILDLYNTAGCNIIVDDIIYFAEPYYSPGIVAQAVDQVDAMGAMYFSSAGNSDRDSYEATYQQGPPLDISYLGAHEFAPGDPFMQVDLDVFDIYFVILQWDQPFFSATGGASAQSDLDLYVYNENLTNIIDASVADNIFTTGDAFEGVILVGAGSINLSIDHWDGPVPNLVKVIIYGASVEYPEYGGDAGTVVGHANTAGACAVGASAWFNTPPYGSGPYALLNNFSSFGGVPILYDAAGTPLAEPLVLEKPDFVGPDGGNTTFFASDIPQDPDVFPNFFGTSASAPHAAAAAALIFEAQPGWAKEDVKSSILETADEMLTPGFDFGSGYGFLNTGAAISAAIPAAAGPNCRDINSSILADGLFRIPIFDMLQNADQGMGAMQVTVERGGQRLYYAAGQYVTDYIILSDACAYLEEPLKVTITNSMGSCWSTLTIKNPNTPIIPSNNATVYCDDPLVQGGAIGGTAPLPFYGCGNTTPATHAADWIIPYDCDPGIQDTVKVIVREWEAFSKDGRRGSSFDTIVVLLFPEIDADHIYCEEKDTLYCADTLTPVGPYITYDSLNTGNCVTEYLVHAEDKNQDGILEFVPTDFDDKCGLTIHVDAWEFNDPCNRQYKVIVDIKQDCYGPAQETCIVPVPAGTPPNGAEQIAPGYWRCEFWVTDLDTLGPEIVCKEPAKMVSTSTHECAAHSYLSPVYVYDDWTGVKQVKATVEGVGSYLLTYNAEDSCYESHVQLKLPKKDGPYYVIYEAYDSCHNITADTCFIYVKDQVKPVAIADKGVTVSLSDKKVWVDAASFDEGSWDNCGVNLLLARRADWYESCIDLCDSTAYCWVGEHHDTIWQSFLEPDKHIDEVEAHYAKTLDWLCHDDVPCGDIIYNAWLYDLMKYATLRCQEHPYEVDDQYFRSLMADAWGNGLYKKFKGNGTMLGMANDMTMGPFIPRGTLFEVELDSAGSTIVAEDLPWSTEIEFDTKTGRLYSEGANGDIFLYELDTETGVLVDAVAHEFGAFNGMEYIKGKLYASFIPDGGEPSELVVVDPETGTFVRIGATGYGPIPGLAYDECTNTLYGVSNGIVYDPDFREDVPELLKIDIESGVATPIGVIGYDAVGSIEFGPDGKLYGGLAQRSEYPGYLIEIDITEGTGSLIGDTGFPGFTGLTATAEGCVEEKLDLYSQIGGGWSDAVPFSCDDACGPVTVEILVMDYWCNWSKAWTEVWVEDKTPVSVEKDVYDVEEISCKTFKDARYSYPGEIHPVSIEYLVAQSQVGDSAALAGLDAIFGGYCKAWIDPYGNYVDADGVEIECDIPFYDSICYCTSYYEQVKVYDDHLGYLWKDSLVKHCYYEADTLMFQKGTVAVNCAENVFCEQEVWSEIDHCGQGYIFRKWKIWQGCPSYPSDTLVHVPDTITRHQRIWIGNECELDKYMFDVPGDTTVYVCELEYAGDGSGQVAGAAGPEFTGYATYNFDDDCRIVGIGHEDKVFKVVGGDSACYKIVRTWYFADWCGYGKPQPDNWWYDREFVVDSCVQKIIVQDTMAPVCVITGPVASGDSIAISACDYDLSVTVDAGDACGLSAYAWELHDITDPAAVAIVDAGGDALTEDTAAFDLTFARLSPGTYKVKVIVTDACNNEHICYYEVTIVSAKKPAPVCVTNVTARLVPWDTDQDGIIDTAHAVVWANEFDRSSTPACDDDSLAFRLEFLDRIGDSTYVDDADSLTLGCADFGTHLVRLWVISYPSGTADYCDVILTVQTDFTGCTTVTGAPGSINEPMGEQQQANRVGKRMDGNENDGVDISGDAGVGQQFDHNGYALEQNRPNPFKEETVIGFVLPESMSATVSFYDVTGRLMHEQSANFSKGYNQIQLNKSQLGTNGLLYYRLKAGTYVETKRMVILE